MALFDTAWYVNYGNGTNTGYYAVAQWTALTAYTVGQFVRQLAAPAVGSERCFVCVVAGTTLAAEPTFVLTRGALTAEAAGPTWQECTGMPGTCGDTTNATTWVASTAYTLGSMIYVASNGSLQILTTAGTSKSGSPPAFSATAGTTTADNTATWTSLGLASGYAAWAKPHARLANAFATTWSAAGNTVFVSNNHAETKAAASTINSVGTFAAPVKAICGNDSVAPPVTPATTASIATTGANSMTVSSTASTFTYYYGITFSAGDGANSASILLNVVNSGSAAYAQFESCTLKLNNSNAASRIKYGNDNNVGAGFVGYKNCSFVFGSTSQQISFTNIAGISNLLYAGCTFAATGSAPTTLHAHSTANANVNTTLRDCDISAITGTLFSGGASGRIVVQNCKLGAGVTIGNAAFSSTNGSFHLSNCDSADTNYRYAYANPSGTLTQETTIVRTGSFATNGVTPTSWSIVTNASCNFYEPFVSEEISFWNELTGAALTITLYLISNTTLNNNDAWAEAELLGTSGNPLGTLVDSRMALLGTAAALTADTSTWGGSTNKYKITLSVTPQKKGLIKIRWYFGKASATSYVDPFPYITDASGNQKSSGRTYLLPGLGNMAETAPSFLRLGMGTING